MQYPPKKVSVYTVQGNIHLFLQQLLSPDSQQRSTLFFYLEINTFSTRELTRIKKIVNYIKGDNYTMYMYPDKPSKELSSVQ